MSRVRPMTAGLTFGAVSVLGHAAWALLVAIGAAQPLIDLVFRLHFMSPAFKVGAFDWSTTLLLLTYAAVVGFGAGAVIAAAWNAFVQDVVEPAPRRRASRAY